MEADGKPSGKKPPPEPTLEELMEQAKKTKEELEIIRKQIADLREAIRRLSNEL